MLIRIIAKAANVSSATVTRVISNNGYVSEVKRELARKRLRSLDMYQIRSQAV